MLQKIIDLQQTRKNLYKMIKSFNDNSTKVEIK